MGRTVRSLVLVAPLGLAGCGDSGSGESSGEDTEGTSSASASTTPSGSAGSSATSASGSNSGSDSSTAATDGDSDSGDGTGGVGNSECGSDLARFESGSRLRARVYAVDDGPDAFVSWYDAELEATCTFALASDGQLRCLPGERATYFADDACTQPALVVGCEAAPAYAWTAEPTTCSSAADAYTLEAPSSGAVYEATGGGCVAAGTMMRAVADTMISPGDLVSAVDEPAEAGGTIRALVRRTADGGCRQIGAWSTEYERPVSQQFVLGSTALWLPSMADPNGAQGSAWNSDACIGTRVAYGCAEASLAISYVPSPTLYELGASVDAADVTVGAPDSCFPFEGDPTQGQWLLGDPIDPNVFDEASVSNVGSARIQARVVVDEAGEPLQFAEEQHDSGRDEVCRWFEDESGTPRCFPLPLGAAPTFEDDACSVPMFVDLYDAGVEGTIAYRIEGAPYNCVEGDRIEAYEVDGIPAAVTSWFSLDDGECTSSTGNGMGYPLVRVDDTEFATATLQTL